jgi:hypothetical protein
MKPRRDSRLSKSSTSSSPTTKWTTLSASSKTKPTSKVTCIHLDVKREELSKKVGVKNPDSSKALLISLMNQGGSSSVAKVDDSAELQKKKE